MDAAAPRCLTQGTALNDMASSVRAEFFFDRNWHSFNSILDIYRTGVLHLNTDMCALVLQKDLEYWQIDELILGKMIW